MQNHPRCNDEGNPIKITNPSQPTLLSAFDNPGEIAVVVSYGETPKAQNGIDLSSWIGIPANTKWLRVTGLANFNEPAKIGKPGMKLSAGVVNPPSTNA